MNDRKPTEDEMRAARNAITRQDIENVDELARHVADLATARLRVELQGALQDLLHKGVLKQAHLEWCRQVALIHAYRQLDNWIMPPSRNAKDCGADVLAQAVGAELGKRL
jgi:hypothetical protein